MDKSNAPSAAIDPAVPMTGAELAALDHDAFLTAFGDVYEHSAWIAEGAWEHAPFRSFPDLDAAMRAVLDASGPDAAVTLVRAFPARSG